ALVVPLEAIPELGSIGAACARQDQLGVEHATLARVVMFYTGALVDDLHASAIGRGPGRAATLGAADRLHAEVVDRQGTLRGGGGVGGEAPDRTVIPKCPEGARRDYSKC